MKSSSETNVIDAFHSHYVKKKKEEKFEFFQVSFHTTDHNMTNDPVNDVQ